MSFKKEYEKVELLLKDYLVFLTNLDENIQSLIKGYKDYFDSYGMNMTPLGLRKFRNGIEKTLSVAKKIYLESLKEDNKLVIDEEREEALINFCIYYYSYLDEKGLDVTMVAYLWNFLEEAKVPFTNFEDLALSKKRVRDIYKELKEK